MTLNAANVRQAIAGNFYWNADGTAPAPTGISTAVAGDYDDLGYISEEGVTLTMPGEGDTTPVKAWQNGATVRIIRTPSEDQPTFHLVFLETKLETIETFFNVTVTRNAESGEFVINTNATRTHGKAVLDVLDDPEAKRFYAPNAIVTEVDEITFNSTDPIGYGVTIAAEFDETLGGQLKVWMTALKAA